MKKNYLVALFFFVLLSLSIFFPPKSIEHTRLETAPGEETQSVYDDRPDRIDEYFASRKMPLEGYGKKFIEEADKNNLDWRLLPAISIKESSGGLHMCRNNPFGWASCKVEFASLDEAIETVAKNLGGNNSGTKAYYSGDTRSKLHSYNGTVEPLYPARVIAIMEAF